MRICSRAIEPHVYVVQAVVRPVRMRTLSGVTFAMTEAEAIDLANALADACEELGRGNTSGSRSMEPEPTMTYTTAQKKGSTP